MKRSRWDRLIDWLIDSTCLVVWAVWQPVRVLLFAVLMVLLVYTVAVASYVVARVGIQYLPL